ncbi:MAG: radical SAM protein [candidate division WOR-3 bacterium]
MKPAYLSIDLKVKKDRALELLKNCQLCPRECKVNRLEGEIGYCQTGRYAIVSSFGPHFGEEPELVGTNGSGTIFFAYCNLSCQYCQNYDISQLGYGQVTNANELAKMMLSLQKMGCHNINLVSPTHIVAQFLEALVIAKEKGLRLPIVYNTGGYDSIQTLRLLEGVVDIYMPDAKYSDSELAQKYSKAPDYFAINQRAIKEMYRQVGDLVTDEKGVAVRGLLVRHLVLPNRLAGSFKVLEFIANEISKDTYVNIMAQYRPCYRADRYLELARRITHFEYQEVIDYARKLGLHRGF